MRCKAKNANEQRTAGVNTLKAIAAMSLNRVIGKGGRIPWHLSEDFQWFKRLTIGQVIVMGRKTFETFERPLPHRTTIVLTRSRVPIPGVQTISDLRQLDLAHETRQVYICGGALAYAYALPFCSDLFLTLVKQVVDGDAFFPTFEAQFEPVEELLDRPAFKILHFHNRKTALTA
ncbi:MAG: dihydrofolate reductase, partial [Candidatus Omnitrophica bacterium]|nr:dihydrofolate reductase [Candidatus Omnitrophota bacterium]